LLTVSWVADLVKQWCHPMKLEWIMKAMRMSNTLTVITLEVFLYRSSCEWQRWKVVTSSAHQNITWLVLAIQPENLGLRASPNFNCHRDNDNLIHSYQLYPTGIRMNMNIDPYTMINTTECFIGIYYLAMYTIKTMQVYLI